MSRSILSQLDKRLAYASDGISQFVSSDKVSLPHVGEFFVLRSCGNPPLCFLESVCCGKFIFIQFIPRNVLILPGTFKVETSLFKV